MQDADECRQGQEPRFSLREHPLNLIYLRSPWSSLLLGSFVEAMRHRSEHLELEERHWLESDMERKTERCRVDLDVMRSNVPEIVWENDWLVQAIDASFVAFTGNDVDVYDA